MRFMKAQVAVESLAAVFLLLLVVIAMTYYISAKSLEDSSTRAMLESEKVCLDVSNMINIVSYSEGHYLEFSIPLTERGSVYNLTVYNGTVEVDYLGHSCVSAITAKSINYRGAPVPFSLCGGTYSINNTGGIVYINNLTVPGC